MSSGITANTVVSDMRCVGLHFPTEGSHFALIFCLTTEATIKISPTPHLRESGSGCSCNTRFHPEINF
jgi:hypothetical protein